jgi:hypothetical protein
MLLLRRAVLGGLAAALLVLPGSAVAADSNSCQPPLVEGTFAGVFTRLAVDSPAPNQTRLCFRVGNAAGGAVTITGAGVSGDLVATDTNIDACRTTLGNQAPGPHPLADALVAGQRVYLEVWRNSGETWLCVGVGSQRTRLIVKTQGVTAPSVRFEQDPDLQDVDPCDVVPAACQPVEPCAVAPQACGDPDPIVIEAICPRLAACRALFDSIACSPGPVTQVVCGIVLGTVYRTVNEDIVIDP